MVHVTIFDEQGRTAAAAGVWYVAYVVVYSNMSAVIVTGCVCESPARAFFLM